MSRQEIPPGWTVASLGDVADVLDARRVPINAEARAKRMGPFPYYGANGQVGTIDGFLFEGEHVLIAEDGGHFDDAQKGVAYVVDGKFWVNNHAHILRARGGIPTRFLSEMLNATDWMPHVSGTTRLKLTQAAMVRVPLAIPPIAEQKRILTRLDALQARSRAARDALAEVPALLELFRRSVLAAAFRGDLTDKWRASHNDLEPASVLMERIRGERTRAWEAANPKKRYVQPKTVVDAELPELPEGWCWAQISDLLSYQRPGMRTGPFGTLLQRADYRPNGIPVIGIENIGPMAFVPGNKVFIEPSKAAALGEYDVQPGDVLISRSGTVGEVCVAPEGIAPARISTNIIRIVLDVRAIDPHFFGFMFVGCSSVLDQVSDLCSGSSRDFLNQSIMSRMVYPLPPRPEQDAILSTVAAFSLRWEALFAALRDQAAELGNLDQSILARAFRGELAEQDPNDEPAEVLLAGIRQQDEAVPTAGSGRARRSTG